MAKTRRRAANKQSSINKTTVKRNGIDYTYYYAVYTEGYDPITGKQQQRKLTGKTQKEVSEKLRKVIAAQENKTYTAPSKRTVAEWLNTWSDEYLVDVKPATVCSYKGIINTHLIPGLGRRRLDELDNEMVQKFVNSLNSRKNEKKLSAKTIKNINGVLHAAMQQAVINKLIPYNPVDGVKLPRRVKPELKPMDENLIAEFLKEIRGHQFEALFITALFTGARESELLAMQWSKVNLDTGEITIDKQLRKVRGSGSEYVLDETKTSNSRTITAPQYVVDALRKIKHKQEQNKAKLGNKWIGSDFVFTNDYGEHLRQNTVYKNLKRVLAKLGSPETRFHDLRHSYAMLAIKSGIEMKVISESMGHSQIGTTMNVYGFVTPQMKKDSAVKIDNFIGTVSA